MDYIPQPGTVVTLSPDVVLTMTPEAAHSHWGEHVYARVLGPSIINGDVIIEVFSNERDGPCRWRVQPEDIVLASKPEDVSPRVESYAKVLRFPVAVR